MLCSIFPFLSNWDAISSTYFCLPLNLKPEFKILNRTFWNTNSGFKLAICNLQFAKHFGSLQMSFCIFSKNCESLKSDTSWIFRVIHWTSSIGNHFKPIKYSLLSNKRDSQYILLQISSQNLVKSLCIFHKMIHNSKKNFDCSRPFSSLRSKLLRIDFVPLIQTLYLYFLIALPAIQSKIKY